MRVPSPSWEDSLEKGTGNPLQYSYLDNPMDRGVPCTHIHRDIQCEIPRSIGFPGSNGKESACSVGDPGSILGLGSSPGGRNWQPTPVFFSREFHGQRSLAGYSPWGHKESNTTEQLTHTHIKKYQINVMYFSETSYLFKYLRGHLGKLTRQQI